MNGVTNKTHFSMKRYRDKIKAEKKEIQLNEKNVEEEWNEKKTKNCQIEKELKKILQHEIT